MQGHIGSKGKIAGPNQEASQRKPHDPDKHSRGEEIGDQIERIPYGPARAERKESFQGIDDVDQEVIDKSIKDERVQQGDERPFFENRLLRENLP
jgi:hypothetical protein